MSIDLAREGVYRFLAAALRDPRDQSAELARDRDSQCLAVEAADWLRMDVPAQAPRHDLGELPGELLTLQPVVARLQDGFNDLCSEYDRVFGLATVKECPPYETEYHATSEPFFRAQQMADVAGFYRAFGLDPSRVAPERPDYLPLEMEFMAFLLMKKRLASEAEDSEHVAICAAAEVSFFSEHLAWWVPAFATGLRRRASSGVYAELAQFLGALVPAERHRLGVAATPSTARPAPIERPEEEPQGCCDWGSEPSGEQEPLFELGSSRLKKFTQEVT
jgi:TorA maturation chaperone TorD